MAVGDGWQRFMLVRCADGVEKVVSFDEFEPKGMVVIPERVTSRVELPEAFSLPAYAFALSPTRR